MPMFLVLNVRDPMAIDGYADSISNGEVAVFLQDNYSMFLAEAGDLRVGMSDHMTVPFESQQI